MWTTILLCAVAWVILAGAGWITLGPLSRRHRDRLLPAAPLIGVSFIVVVLHDTTVFTSVRTGAWVLAAVLVVLVALSFRRDRFWWVSSRSTLGKTALTAGAGIVPGLVALLPVLRAGGGSLVQGNLSSDAFYYVTLNQWLLRNPGVRVPRIPAVPAVHADPPSYGPVIGHLRFHLRIGEELAQSFLDVVLHAQPATTWSGLTALWVALIPAGTVGAACCLRMQFLTGLLLGSVAGTATLVYEQVLGQNAASLLGIALAPLAFGLVVQALGRHPRLPVVVGSLVLAAWIGVYTEFTPIVLPAFAVAVLLRRPPDIRWVLARALVLLGVAVVMAPLVWANAARSLLFIGGLGGDYFGSPFLHVTIWQLVNRVTGASTLQDTGRGPQLLGVVFASTAVVGMLGVVLSRRRAAVLLLALTGGFAAWYLGTVKHRPYSQVRTVEIWLPLALLAAAFGLDRLIRAAGRPDRGSARPVQAGIVALSMAVSLVWVVSNVARDRETTPSAAVLRTRQLDGTFGQAAGWIRRLDARGGGNTLVLAGNMFSQLWITDALRSQRLTSYPSLYVSYQDRARYWDGRLRRYLLVDQSVLLDADRGVVIRHNPRFRLLDLSRGQALVAVAADEFGTGNEFILRTPKLAARVRVFGLPVTGSGHSPVPRKEITGRPLPPGTITRHSRRIVVDLAPQPGSVVYLFDGRYHFLIRRIQRVSTH